MRAMGLQAQRGRRHRPPTPDSRHDRPIAPNRLGRSLGAERPDTVWLADLSDIPTDEGFLDLAALKDLATRASLGWAMAEHLKVGLGSDALVMALQRCHPGRGLIHHRDRGVPSASGPDRAVLEPHGIQPSMSRRGNGLDTAPMESFLASLKTERGHEARVRTRAEARAAVFASIEVFDNRQRLHSALGYRTPVEARASMAAITLRKAASNSDLIPPLTGFSRTFGATRDLEGPGNSLARHVCLVSPRHLRRESRQQRGARLKGR